MVAFAKAFAKASREGYLGPDGYTVTTVRHGFAGSGEWTFTHVAGGDTFTVIAVPNGKGFWGTSYDVVRHSA